MTAGIIPTEADVEAAIERWHKAGKPNMTTVAPVQTVLPGVSFSHEDSALAAWLGWDFAELLDYWMRDSIPERPLKQQPAPVTYIPGWLDPDPADELFAYLMGELAWVRQRNNRQEYWDTTLGRPYTYGAGVGARTYEPNPCDEEVGKIRDGLKNERGVYYAGCFLNRYDNGTDNLGWHADDDPGIDHTKPIAVVSLGQERIIQFKDQGRGSHPETMLLEHGSLLLMGAGMQFTHFHQIPKMPGMVGLAANPRISMTFRALLP